MSENQSERSNERPSHFIRKIIDEDIQSGKHGGRVVTRFPPEPNGYLHIGHAKSICLNFGLAEDFNGSCNLRFDDTNPQKENVEFVEAIKTDVQWLGYDWQDRLFYASDYFEKLYGYAVELINNGKAYVCDLNAEQTREYRGSLTSAGKNSPYRDRSVEENLDLFARMRAGEFADGTKLLRAKIDMASPNMNMRDPVLYRIRLDVTHHQTGKDWPIYPMYDFTHPLSDALEGITHSLCTLEFEDHRPLYDWVLDNVSIECHPQQIEFSRLNLEYTVMSKRKLTLLIEKGLVDGWSDPRMPTLAGLRRRGYTPQSIREFCDRIGVTRSNNVVEMSVLESCIRDDLNEHAPRRMAVLRPLKVVIENMSDDQDIEIEAQNHPQQPEMGSRKIKLTRELYIDQDDFKEEASRKFKRLVAGGEVRLRYGFVIRCDQVIKNDAGEIVELRCSCDMATLGAAPEGRKVKGVIHWVSAKYGQPADVRLYDRLFSHETPESAGVDDFTTLMNPESLQTLTGCMTEPALAESVPGAQCQFEREGYFCLDAEQVAGEKLVFNRVVTLRDTWAKIDKKN